LLGTVFSHQCRGKARRMPGRLKDNHLIIHYFIETRNLAVWERQKLPTWADHGRRFDRVMRIAGLTALILILQPSSKELGGTGFPACAKNTLLLHRSG
jgi:hypothetical protein